MDNMSASTPSAKTDAEHLASLFRPDDVLYQGYTPPTPAPVVIDVPDDFDVSTLPHPALDAPGGCTLPTDDLLTDDLS